jgi:hypothetical protein
LVDVVNNRAERNVVDRQLDSGFDLRTGVRRESNDGFVTEEPAGVFGRNVFLAQVNAIGAAKNCDINAIIYQTKRWYLRAISRPSTAAS